MRESSEKAQLYLLIGGIYYLVERIPFDGEQTKATGWKLNKFDDRQGHGPYCVIRQPSGRITCECADFTFAGQREQRPCKHIKAVQQIGLFQ